MKMVLAWVLILHVMIGDVFGKQCPRWYVPQRVWAKQITVCCRYVTCSPGYFLKECDVDMGEDRCVQCPPCTYQNERSDSYHKKRCKRRQCYPGEYKPLVKSTTRASLTSTTRTKYIRREIVVTEEDKGTTAATVTSAGFSLNSEATTQNLNFSKGDECKCAVSMYASLATGTLSMVLTGVLTYVLMRNRRKEQNYQQTKTRQRFQGGILENRLTIINSSQCGYTDSDLDPYSYINSECGKDNDIYLEPIT